MADASLPVPVIVWLALTIPLCLAVASLYVPVRAPAADVEAAPCPSCRASRVLETAVVLPAAPPKAYAPSGTPTLALPSSSSASPPASMRRSLPPLPSPMSTPPARRYSAPVPSPPSPRSLSRISDALADLLEASRLSPSPSELDVAHGAHAGSLDTLDYLARRQSAYAGLDSPATIVDDRRRAARQLWADVSDESP